MDEQLRASDRDREAVVATLHAAAADGRLDPDELEERVGAAFAARTHADLAPLTRDLPPLPVPRPRGPRGLSERMRQRLAGALTADVICSGIWVASGAHGYFWPAWVIFGTGVGLVGPVIHRALGVEHSSRHRHRSHHEHHRRSRY